jgi:hypothetical protein
LAQREAAVCCFSSLSVNRDRAGARTATRPEIVSPTQAPVTFMSILLARAARAEPGATRRIAMRTIGMRLGRDTDFLSSHNLRRRNPQVLDLTPVSRAGLALEQQPNVNTIGNVRATSE